MTTDKHKYQRSDLSPFSSQKLMEAKMGFQQEIENFITGQFDRYRLYENGKHWQDAYEAAKTAKTLDKWVFKEVSKSTLAGAAEMAIPGMGIPLAAAGIGYLLSQMARVSWGIGALKNAAISETEGLSDLGNILSIWGQDDSIKPIFLALSARVLTEYTSDPKFQEKVDNIIIESEAELTEGIENSTNALSRDKLILTSVTIIPIVAGAITNSSRSAKLIGTIGAAATVAVGTQVARKQLSKQLHKRVGRGIGKRVATTVATRLATRAGSRAILTWIPVMGALANAGLNLTTLQSMKNAASEYYGDKLEVNDINRL